MPFHVIFDPSMNIGDAPGNIGDAPGNELRNNDNTEDQSPNTILTILIACIIMICVFLALAFLFSSKRRR